MELLKAVQAGKIDDVSRLINEGADPNEPGYEGVTPLMAAAIGGYPSIAAVLLDHGAALNACDECDQTALAQAISQGNDDVTELLLKRGADPGAQNWLAFSFAVRFGSVPLVSRLLDLGADPNVQDDDDPTPLMEAVGRGNRELVRLLLDAGADLEKTAEGGATAFDVAVQHREKEIVKLLEPRVTPSARTLQAAVQGRDTRLVERLIARGVPVNFCDEQFGYTPLSWAAENGSTRIARRLIEAGADLEARDWMNQTPLWAAVMHNRVRVVRVLLEAGANFNLRDDSGDTLLESAIWAEAVGSVRLLLEAGADPNQVGGGAPGALHWAVSKDAPEVIDLLLQAGADPNLGLPGGRDTGMFEGLNPGTTPLMIAAAEGNLPLVNRLLVAGADWSLCDSKGKTAVDLASGNGHTQILKRLEQAGATVNYGSKQLHNAALLKAVEHQNVDGVRQALAAGAQTDLKQKATDRSPLMQAALDGNPEVVKLLLDAGADPNQRTQWDECALVNAVVRAHTEVVRQLLAAGVEVNIEYKPQSVPSGERNTVIFSRFCPLADAVSQGEAEITDLLLQAGADPNLLASSGDNPLLAAVTSRHADLARRLLNAGAKPQAEDADYLDVLQWEQRAAAAAYQRSIHEIQEVTGLRPEPLAGLPGAHSVRLSIAEEESSSDEAEDRTEAMLQWSKKFKHDYQSLTEQMQAVIDELQQRVTERGYHLLDGGMPLGCGPLTRFLVLLPTANPFAVMAAFGTHGNDDELSNRELIAWFRDFGQEHPFVLRGCKYDTVVIQLERPLEDPKTWAKRLVDFDSDIWPDELPRFEKHLETATRIHFWWD